MSKPTPGPWRTYANGHCVGAADGGVAMCSMTVRTDDEAIANARLIAAAPDLLDAVASLLPSTLVGEGWDLRDNERVEITITFGTLRAARAAIARAKGEPA